MIRDYRLYNRYKVDVRLVQVSEDDDTLWRLELPEEEAKWLQISYDNEEVVHEDGTKEFVEVDYSVDPSGGPYIAVGPNTLSLAIKGEIDINVESIKLENKKVFLKILKLEERL